MRASDRLILLHTARIGNLGKAVEEPRMTRIRADNRPARSANGDPPFAFRNANYSPCPAIPAMPKSKTSFQIQKLETLWTNIFAEIGRSIMNEKSGAPPSISQTQQSLPEAPG